jgi:hypothetical protein
MEPDNDFFRRADIRYEDLGRYTLHSRSVVLAPRPLTFLFHNLGFTCPREPRQRTGLPPAAPLSRPSCRLLWTNRSARTLP